MQNGNRKISMDYFYHHTTQDKPGDVDENKRGYLLLEDPKDSTMKNKRGFKP